MTNKQKVEQFRKIVNEMADLYEKKNENYGDSFGKLYDTLGAKAGLVPLHNKLDRVTNLIKGGKNDFESVEDTFKDLACYAIMNLIERIDAKENEVKSPKNKKAPVEKKKVLVNHYEEKDKYENLKWPCKECINRDYQLNW